MARLTANYLDNKAKKVNFLIVGYKGSGKTHILKTMPQPIHIDSFDPGGSLTLIDEIEEGKVVPDRRWEAENDKQPWAFKAWDDEFLRRLRGGYFDHIGTYVLDSLSLWSDALMNYITSEDSRAGTAPWQSDYGLQQIMAKTAVKMIGGLPCYTIITAHLDTMKDEITGAIVTSLLFPGKGSTKIPLPIDEMYVLETKEVPVAGKGMQLQRNLITQPTGKYRACTRMGRNGLFALREEADLGRLIKKAGFPFEHKPLFK